MTRIGVCGAAGRMGRTILAVCYDTDGIIIGAAIEHPQSSMLGLDVHESAGLGKRGVVIASEIAAVADDFDVLIDFTLAEATAANVERCRAAGKRMVIGTTGLDEAQKNLLKAASRDIAIVCAPNMSIGVNLCFKLAELATRIIGAEADIEIIEAHHNQKQDAPSGTAIRLGEIIADTLGRELKECAVYGREGITGVRDKNTIGFATIRAGDIIGEHSVLFAAAGERIEISHKASSRRPFAVGALRAARWLMQKQSGLYDMQDVLGLR